MDPATILLGDLICDTEPTLEIIRCERIGCPFTGNCIFKNIALEGRDRFIEVLNKYTLAEYFGQFRSIERFAQSSNSTH